MKKKVNTRTLVVTMMCIAILLISSVNAFAETAFVKELNGQPQEVTEKVILPSGEEITFTKEISVDKVVVTAKSEGGETVRVINDNGNIYLNGRKIWDSALLDDETLQVESTLASKASSSIKWGKWSEGVSTVTKVHEYTIVAIASIIVSKSPHIAVTALVPVAVAIIEENYPYLHVRVQSRSGHSQEKIGSVTKEYLHSGQKTTISGRKSKTGSNHHIKTIYTSQKRPA